METLQRTVSDIASELSKEAAREADGEARPLPLIYELEDAKCECCRMSEEYTPESARRVREKFSGKMVCGLLRRRCAWRRRAMAGGTGRRRSTRT